MKKMMTALAVVLIAGLTQAASIDWAITGANPIKDTVGVNLGNASVYLVLDGNQASIAAAITAGTFSGGTAGILDSRTTLAVAPRNLALVTATSGMLTAGTAYQYAVLVFNETYTGVGGSTGSYKFTTLSASTAAYLAGTDDPTAISFGATAFSGTSFVGYTVVPEPTSMALLALGVAAVGLRRRFRK